MLLIWINLWDSTHWNGPVGLEVQIDFLLFHHKYLFFQLNFGIRQCILEIWQSLMIHVITEWWKVDFEKKALKFWESGICMRTIVNQSPFYMKMLFLGQIFQVTERVRIEYSKIYDISKFTLEPYFWLSTRVAQNHVFQQLVSLDMLSHIYTLCNIMYNSGYFTFIWSCHRNLKLLGKKECKWILICSWISLWFIDSNSVHGTLVKCNNQFLICQIKFVNGTEQRKKGEHFKAKG